MACEELTCGPWFLKPLFFECEIGVCILQISLLKRLFVQGVFDKGIFGIEATFFFEPLSQRFLSSLDSLSMVVELKRSSDALKQGVWERFRVCVCVCAQCLLDILNASICTPALRVFFGPLTISFRSSKFCQNLALRPKTALGLLNRASFENGS